MICKCGLPRSIEASRAQWFWAHQNQDALMLVSASLDLRSIDSIVIRYSNWQLICFVFNQTVKFFELMY
jgi:hypothetical protein